MNLKYASGNLKDIAHRLENAETNFVAAIRMLADCTEEDAKKVLRLYVRFKLVKRSLGIGAINVKHGSYLDKSAILKAINFKE